MSLTIKHLNADASFLLTFRPILPFPPTSDSQQHSFSIVLDPWLCGSSDVFHHKFATSRQKESPSISSLADLPEPDLVIVSQNMTDHCHKETLTVLPSHLGKAKILAPLDAAETVKGWKYFDSNKIIPLRKWDHRKESRIYRVTLPAISPGGETGEIAIVYLEDNWNKDNMAKVHNAIGITYKPPTYNHSPQDGYSVPMTPPDTPMSSSFTLGSHTTLSPKSLSVIFSPHGCNTSTLASYTTHHLIPTAALPLTALLHCFDEVKNTWYFGGKICNGMPGGVGIAQALNARVWISAHDADKEVGGISIKKLGIKKYEREVVEAVVSPRREGFVQEEGTKAVILGVGEELVLSSVDLGDSKKVKRRENDSIDGVLSPLSPELAVDDSWADFSREWSKSASATKHG